MNTAYSSVVLHEMGHWLNDLYGSYRDRGHVKVAISLDTYGPQAMEPIVRKMVIAFPVYWVAEEATRAHDIYAVPLIYMGRAGGVRAGTTGRRRWSTGRRYGSSARRRDRRPRG